MTLRQRTLVLVGANVAVLVAVLWQLMSSVTLRSLERLERHEMVVDVQRAARALEESIAELDLKGADWAIWDDTWHFAVDRNPAYIASNMADQSFANLHMNAVVIADVKGEVIYSKQVNGAPGEPIPPLASLLTALTAPPSLVRFDQPDQSHRGILMLPEGPALITARPILTSEAKGPIHGGFVFVRYLSHREVERLSERTLIHVSLHSARSRNPSPDLRAGLEALARGDSIEIRPLDDQTIAGYTMLKDLMGSPALVLRIEAHRTLYLHGLRSMSVLLWSVPAIAFVFGGLVLWVLERQVLQRLAQLGAQVARIGQTGTAAVPIVLEGSDELARLGRTFNESLAALDASQRQIRENEKLLREARDAAEAANRAKSGFLAAMSHEIRTPMNGVLGMTSLLLDAGLTPAQREFAVTIQNSAEALLGIINDILDFSKIEAGKLTIEALPFDLSTAIDDVCDLLLPRVREKNIELVVRYAEDAPHGLVGDSGRIRQVLLNLIGNAIKFTAQGHVLVSVDATPAAPGHAAIEVHVKDTGVGISPEAIGRLFQVFSQADATTTRKFGGTGLGLAISKRIIEAMGGEVGVESEVGRGSDFWWKLTLPLDPAHVGPVRTEGLAGRRVLIVDDAEVTRTVLAEKLASRGMTTGAATRGFEALVMLREAAAAGRPYDLALVDALMPEMDGEQLGKAVRREASIAATQLVILTGQPGPGDGVRFEAAGFDGYLVKPVRDAVLIRALVSVLDTPRDQRSGIVTRHSIDEGGAIPTAAAVEQATFGGLRVLIAEDNSTNQRIIVRMLTKLDCRVGIAANGLETVTMAKDFPFDLILMDMQMPEMDGLEASARIRELGGPHASIPIVALTANAMESDREACMRAGMDDYIAKPVKREELVRTLQRWQRERTRKAA